MIHNAGTRSEYDDARYPDWPPWQPKITRRGSTMLDRATLQRLDARALAVGDKAIARGDRALQDAVQSAREYLASPNADATAAMGLIAGLERAAGIGAPKNTRGSSAPPEAATLPATTTPITAVPVKAGMMGDPLGWWSTLSSGQRVAIGVGSVAAVAIAWHVWGSR